VLSVALFDRPAYRAALVTGHGLDDVGRKMSKSKGNVTEPIDLLRRLGGDAVRWFAFSTDFTEGMRMGEDEIRSQAQRTVGTLLNVLAFYHQNASADGLAPIVDRPRPASVLDRWLLSRLEGTRATVESSLDRFDPRPGAQALRSFVDDLSTWYLRRSRPRFWRDARDPAREEAHATLSYTLATFARVLAPFLPFTSEWIGQHFVPRPFSRAEDSVHLGTWPAEAPTRDLPLEEGMRVVRSLVEAGHELRQRAAVKARIPLPELVLFGPVPDALRPLGGEATELIATELNVRRVRWVPEYSATSFPDGDWVTAPAEGAVTAALSRRPTPELLEEGLVREVLRRLQQRRKELQLAFTDPVDLVLAAPPELAAALTRRRETLVRELLALTLEIQEGELAASEATRRWEFDGNVFSATMARAAPGRPAPPARASARPRPAGRPPRRRPPRTARPASRPRARPRSAARPSRRSARGTPRHPSPARRRPGAATARSRRGPKRSVRPSRRRPTRAGPRHRRRRSARGR